MNNELEKETIKKFEEMANEGFIICCNPHLALPFKDTVLGNRIKDLIIQSFKKQTDGYHTFEELYEHRNRLFITLLKMINALDKESGRNPEDIWCSTLHSDGSKYDDWFILGIGKETNKQISYHLPARFWNEVCEFAQVLDKAPEWDGHTSQDVLERLNNL